MIKNTRKFHKDKGGLIAFKTIHSKSTYGASFSIVASSRSLIFQRSSILWKLPYWFAVTDDGGSEFVAEEGIVL
jgi:hypothetical protein